MKKKIRKKNEIKSLGEIYIILIIVSIIIGIILVLFDPDVDIFNKRKLAKLRYDIVVEENNNRNVYYDEEKGMITPKGLGGYANNYSYTLINSKTNEKIEINYQYIYSMHEEKDNVSVEISSISDDDIKKYVEKYGKSEKLLSVKDIIDMHHKDYKVNSIEKNN